MRPLSTTKAQLTGHRFLRKRVEHGLVLGDIRMIHDPLGKRTKALGASAALCALIAAGAGILAWLEPKPNPAEALIVRTEGGQLLAQVDGLFHPVPNQLSGQLLVGEPAPVRNIAAEHLRDVPLGPAFGIPDAPGFLAPGDVSAEGPGEAAQQRGAWGACLTRASSARSEFEQQLLDDGVKQELVVHADLELQELAPGQAALVRAGEEHWLLSAQGRTRLEDVTALADAPVFTAPPQFLAAVPEAVAQATSASDADLAGREPTWLCATGDPQRPVALARPARTLPLAGATPADAFGGVLAGGVVVTTGQDLVVVGSAGTRHLLEPDAAAALGVRAEDALPVAWEILRLLPEGSVLARA